MNRLAAWLLVLVPALAIGAVTLGLLVREDARRREREEQAAQAVRAAALERLQTAAESLGIVIEEVRTGLLAALADLPESTPDAAFAGWAADNPLVRQALVWDPAQGWVLPAAGSPGRARLEAFLTAPAPWRKAAPPAATLAVTAPLAAAAPAPALPAAREESAAQANLQRFRDVREQVANDARSTQRQLAASAPPPAASAAPAPLSVLDDAADADGLAEVALRREARADTFAATGSVEAQGPGFGGTDAPPRAEWFVHGEGTGRVVVAWHERADGRVRALELDRPALALRLVDALPRSDAGAFALVDPRGVQMPAALRSTDLFVELGGLLEGWTLAFQPVAAPYGSAEVNILALGAVFTVAVVALIVAGSVLLLRQVRLAEDEARERATFASNVSHEFKTPLTTIRLYADLLRRNRGADATEKEARYLETITAESERLAQLVGRVLDLGRLERGRLEPRREAVDLAALVVRLAETQRPRLAGAGVVLRVEGADAPYPWRGDAALVDQVLLNLLDNVVKYAASGGEAVVALARGPGGGPRVDVLDRGPGVPPAFRRRLFRRFERADDRLDARASGTGIGLHLARGLARAQGGDLVHEPRPGGGACFRLALPPAATDHA